MFRLTLSAVIALSASGPLAAAIITNGGFETPTIAPASFSEICPGSEPSGFGWSVLNASCSDIFNQGVLGSTAAVFEGTQALDLVGVGSNGEIAQTFATTPGLTYTLSFAYANNPISTSTASAALTVKNGVVTLLADTVTHNTSTNVNFNWTLYSKTFLATGTSATLDFTETVGGNNGGVLLDAVAINTAAVSAPEPSALILAAIGLTGLISARLRRR